MQLREADGPSEVKSMARTSIADSGWLSISEAGRYALLAPAVIRGAIVRGELPAYVRPATRREAGRPQYRVSKRDIDVWMRSQPSAREAMCGD